MTRIPRKTKKDLKKKYLHRYGVQWLSCDNILTEYIWFYKNALKFDMNKSLVK
jgi:hypothetical protein